MDCRPSSSSIHVILQARIPAWVVIPFSRGSYQPRSQPGSPALQAYSLPSKTLVCVCVYIYIYIHTHTHIYSYIYIYSIGSVFLENTLQLFKDLYLKYGITCKFNHPYNLFQLHILPGREIFEEFISCSRGGDEKRRKQL